MRSRFPALVLVVLGLSLAGASPAGAAPIFNLDLHHVPTNFTPEGKGEYWVDIHNVGPDPTAGEVKVTLSLQSGITREDTRTFSTGSTSWDCPGSPGDSTVTCTTTDVIKRHRRAGNLAIMVKVGAIAGSRLATATVEGGGAVDVAVARERSTISATPAGFGVVAESFVPDFFDRDGLTTERGAGAHPELLTVPFDFNTIDSPLPANPEQKLPDETVRDLVVDLPPGFVGDPTAVAECTAAEFNVGECPRASQVGRIDIRVVPPTNIGPDNPIYLPGSPVFNLSHPVGSVTDLGFIVSGNPIHVRVSLDPSNRYAVRSTVSDINETLPTFDQRLTIWGVPADPVHDYERCEIGLAVSIETDTACPANVAPTPFLSVPAQCEEEVAFRLHSYDSWQDPGAYGPGIEHPLPGEFEDCDKPRFSPGVEIGPTGDEAGTPTGLNVSVHVPQNDNPDALATPPVKSTTVVLPEGMAVNPAFSDGLQGCSEEEIGISHDGVPNGEAVRCPDNSRIGEVELETPLLPKALEGSMYLAEQGDNPFGSLLALYLAIHDTEKRGVLVKVPGEVKLDPRTGQITTVFDELPQLPFEDLTLKFRSGERAPLVNPPTCGTHRIEATMSSYARPEEPSDVSSAYELGEGPDGSPCVSLLPDRPFDPQLLAGSINPVAGAFSPLHLRVTRSDAEQEISSVQGSAPLGLSASLIGVQRCSEAQIAQALARSAPGEGAKEKSDPSCPASSQVGSVDTGAGAGPSPIYVPGKIYLAGPYKGAPLSGVAIVPAVAGPVDLGVVVVRAPAHLDPRTAQLSIASDELPQVVNGVLVRVRDVRIRLDRPDFTINPTSCAEKGFAATAFSAEGKAAELANRFQVGECGSLDFRPRIALRLSGGVRRGAHPALTAVVRPRPGHANFQRAAVTLPRSAFLEQAHIRTICTRVQFAAGEGNGAQCPRGAIYGSARAWSPLVEGAFEGPVILRSSNHNLPDMVVALKGPDALPIDIELSSRIDSVRLGREAAGIRSTFTAVPDVPVSRFALRMQGGRKGLIVNSKHLCYKAKRNRARANLLGQNGRRAALKPLARAVRCRKLRKAKARQARAERSSRKG